VKVQIRICALTPRPVAMGSAANRVCQLVVQQDSMFVLKASMSTNCSEVVFLSLTARECTMCMQFRHALAVSEAVQTSFWLLLEQRTENYTVIQKANSAAFLWDFPIHGK
jgi:hypothetical protein